MRAHARSRLRGHPARRPGPGRAATWAWTSTSSDALWAPLQAELHYACLNDIPGLENPTSELLARWIWERIKPALPALSWVTVYETAPRAATTTASTTASGRSSASRARCSLQRAPDGDPRRRLHGHSYLLRLHLTAPLDEVLGWTVDYGDVKALFKPVYARLDHHRLNELPGLRDADPGQSGAVDSRGRWRPTCPQLDRIDLYETPGCGAILCWGDLGPRCRLT